MKAQNMLITESSDHLQCRYDARNDVLDPFIDKMTRLQRHYHQVTLEALKKRIKFGKLLRKKYLSKAQETKSKIEDEIDDLMQQKLSNLSLHKNES